MERVLRGLIDKVCDRAGFPHTSTHFKEEDEKQENEDSVGSSLGLSLNVNGSLSRSKSFNNDLEQAVEKAGSVQLVFLRCWREEHSKLVIFIVRDVSYSFANLPKNTAILRFRSFHLCV